MDLKTLMKENGIELKSSTRQYSPLKRGIRINQIGYPVNAAKIAVVEPLEGDEFEVMTIDASVSWRSVMRGKLERKGSFITADFSNISTPGDYMLVCRNKSSAASSPDRESHSFIIADFPYRHAARLMTEYFIWQRCGSLRGWAGLCHQEPSHLVDTGRTLDTAGGYHQSCDLRCWNDGISSAVYAYLRYAELSNAPWEKGIFEEEIRWGCDYFMKLISPEGFIYDSQFVPLGWGARDYYNTPTPLGAHCNIVALLARSARFFEKKDPIYSQRCLQSARQISHFIQTTPVFDTPYVCSIKDLPPGTQGTDKWYYQNYKNSATGLSGRLRIALELDDRKDADSLLMELAVLQDPETGFFRESAECSSAAYSDCSYTFLISGPLAIADYLAKNPENMNASKTLEKYLDALSAMLELLGFEFAPRYYNEFESRKNVVVMSTSAGLMLHYSVLFSIGAGLLERKDYKIAAQRTFDWICGVNGEEASLITGVGYNQKRNPVFGQFFPSTPQIPGGVQHTLEGEYDMPSVGMALWASSLLG